MFISLTLQLNLNVDIERFDSIDMAQSINVSHANVIKSFSMFSLFFVNSILNIMVQLHWLYCKLEQCFCSQFGIGEKRYFYVIEGTLLKVRYDPYSNLITYLITLMVRYKVRFRGFFLLAEKKSIKNI